MDGDSTHIVHGGLCLPMWRSIGDKFVAKQRMKTWSGDPSGIN